MYKRAQAILEKDVGQEHPKVATMLNKRALMLESQVRADREGEFSGQRKGTLSANV